MFVKERHHLSQVVFILTLQTQTELEFGNKNETGKTISENSYTRIRTSSGNVLMGIKATDLATALHSPNRQFPHRGFSI